MRTIIIGDIHGCYQQTVTLLEKVGFDEEMDRLISLGDLIDRGEQSYEVFDLFRRLKLAMGDRCVLIRGNHEQMMIDSVTDPDSQLSWRSNGGGMTVRSFRSHKDSIHQHTGWFQKNMVLYYQDKHFQCTHAGLQDDPIDRTPADTLLWDRDSIRQNSYGGRLTIIGHTPLNAPAHFFGDGQNVMLLPYHQKMPLPEKGLICLDTGCFFQGRLTAMVIEGRQFWLESAEQDEIFAHGKERTGDAPRPSQSKGLTGFLQKLLPSKER